MFDGVEVFKFLSVFRDLVVLVEFGVVLVFAALGTGAGAVAHLN